MFSLLCSLLTLASRYTFGYGRYEVLSGFTNGILLVFVSLMVLGEGIGRLFGDPEIDAEHLTIVAVAGFCVNLIGWFLVCMNVLNTVYALSSGLFAFHDLAHNHGGSSDCTHNHGHGDEEEASHSHSHDTSCSHRDNCVPGHSDGLANANVKERMKNSPSCNHSKNTNISGVSGWCSSVMRCLMFVATGVLAHHGRHPRLPR